MARAPFNLTVFNLVAAQAFERLYSQFPLQTSLRPTELAGHALAAMEGVEDFDGMEANLEARAVAADRVARDAFEWLRAEGYVRFENAFMDTGEILDIVLTEKALTILNGVPKAIERREPMIDRLKEAVKEEGSKRIAEHAADAIKGIIAIGAQVFT